uniref:Uncharacterized protein n=1 Tax=Siphoviridae sp. ctCIv11 TaxID=2827806 RepID=A0A8S5S219_9CAUD|nr:MAG TPA: hypothetical protein [Siphoviridae sp. ctCIv11]
MKKGCYYALIFLIILIEWIPMIMAFFSTSIKTDCLFATFDVLGWILFISILISQCIQIKSHVNCKKKKRKAKRN